MKTKLSISLDEETLAQLEQLLAETPQYRSTSHFVELALREKLEALQGERQ